MSSPSSLLIKGRMLRLDSDWSKQCGELEEAKSGLFTDKESLLAEFAVLREQLSAARTHLTQSREDKIALEEQLAIFMVSIRAA